MPIRRDSKGRFAGGGRSARARSATKRFGAKRPLKFGMKRAVGHKLSGHGRMAKRQTLKAGARGLKRGSLVKSFKGGKRGVTAVRSVRRGRR